MYGKIKYEGGRVDIWEGGGRYIGCPTCWIKNVILEKTEVSFTVENVLYLY